MMTGIMALGMADLGALHSLSVQAYDNSRVCVGALVTVRTVISQFWS